MKHPYSLAFALLSLVLFACGDDRAPTGNADDCPTAAPEGDPCSTPSLRCAYGYAPPECGGITVECTGERWEEVSHTDPMPSCFGDGGVDDGGSSGDGGLAEGDQSDGA
jgi:hypothetical protein